MSINNTPQGDALVTANQEQAKAMGVTIPGPGFSYTKPPEGTSYSEMATAAGPAYRISTGPSYASTVDANAGKPIPTSTATPTAGTGTSSTGNTALDQANADKVAADQAVTDASTKFDKAITDIQSGAIPLNAGEKAQVDALNQQFQQLITDQAEQNQRDTEQQNMLDFREGRTQYMPGAHIKTISDLTTKGYAKISKLAVQQAGAVAELTQALKDNDIKHIKEAYDAVQEANKNRQTAIKETVTAIQKKIDDAKAEKIAADKVTYDTVTKPIEDLTKQVTTYNAPQSVINAVKNSKTVSEAMAAGAGYFQDPTSLGGQYASYVKAATAAGQTPISPEAFVNRQEYNKAYNTALGTAAGKLAGGGDEENSDIKNNAIQLVEGQLAPSQLKSRSTYSAILAAANKYSQDTYGKPFDPAKADRDYKYASLASTANTLKFIQSLTGTNDGSGALKGGSLDYVIELSNQRLAETGPHFGVGAETFSANETQFPPLNDVNQWAAIKTGDPKMAAYYGALLEVSDQVAKILQGGSTGSVTSDAKLREAQSLFDSGFTAAQIDEVATTMKVLIGNRAKTMVGENAYLSDYANDFGAEPAGDNATNKQIIMDEALAESKITQFHDASPENAALIDAIHSQFPLMSAQEAAKKLNLMQ